VHAVLQRARLLVPGCKPCRTCANKVHFNRGPGRTALQHAVLLDLGRTRAKIVPFNPGPRLHCGLSASSAPSSGSQTWPDLSKNVFFLLTQVLGQTAALQKAVLLVPGRKQGRTCI
jgi:hypothetical protein